MPSENGAHADGDRRRSGSRRSKTIDLGQGMRPMGTQHESRRQVLYVSTGRSKMAMILDTSTNTDHRDPYEAGRPSVGHRPLARREDALHCQRTVRRCVGHRHRIARWSRRRSLSVTDRGALPSSRRHEAARALASPLASAAAPRRSVAAPVRRHPERQGARRVGRIRVLTPMFAFRSRGTVAGEARTDADGRFEVAVTADGARDVLVTAWGSRRPRRSVAAGCTDAWR
mgnify:CR=1 FL=1